MTNELAFELNGKPARVENGKCVADLLKEMGYGRQAVVIVNQKKLLQSEYRNTIIQKDDNLFIFKPLGGG